MKSARCPGSCRRRDLRDRREALVRVGEPEVPQVHVRLDRLQLDRQRQRVAERAVGVREAPVQRRVLAVGRRGHDPAVPGQDLHRQDRLMRHAAAQRRGLDAKARDRAAERDGLQLRHDQRHEPVPERGVDQVLVGGHPADDGRPVSGSTQITARTATRRAWPVPGIVAEPEQVRGGLRQPDPAARRDRRVGALDRGDRLPGAASRPERAPVRPASLISVTQPPYSSARQ